MQTPEAIESITREEDYWRTIYFDDFSTLKKTIILERHKDDGYTFATVEGTDTEILEALDSVEGHDIPRTTALEFRRKYDHNWAGRETLQRRALALHHKHVLEPLGAGAVGTTIDLQDYSQASGLTITISGDGSLSTVIEDPVMLDDFDGRTHRMDWHEYELPRHVSYGIHRVRHAERSHSIPKTIYNPLTVVRTMVNWFKVAESFAD